MKNEKWFALDISQVEKKLKTNAASGLSRKAARSRRDPSVGSVFYPYAKSPLRMLGEMLADFALILLLLTASVSLFFEELQSGLTVLALVLFHVVVSCLLYYRTQRYLEGLSGYFRPYARVVRGGKLFYTDYAQVVPGDVLLLEPGDVIGCDARLISSDRLSVSMRVNREEYITLEKTAHGIVRPEENDARKMVNMLHAGSVIESGCARAIVTEVGTYTYLGAMTGGIEEDCRERTPQNLRKMKKSCARISMISMLCVLPFCIISLVISYIRQGEVLLSYAFLTALAVSASSMVQASVTVFKLFYAQQIRRSEQGGAGGNYAVPRSSDVFDRLAQVDELFLLDGSALTDGMIHFRGAVIVSGELRNFSRMPAEGDLLCKLASLYSGACQRFLTAGNQAQDRYAVGLEQFLGKTGTDGEAVKILYPTTAYFPGNHNDIPDRVCFTDKGERRMLSVFHTPEGLSGCGSAVLSGERRPLTAEGVEKLKQLWATCTAGGRGLIFTLSDGIGGESCFVGFLAFREGIEPALARKLSVLQKAGVHTVAFSHCPGRQDAPEIPAGCVMGAAVSKETMLRQNRALTDGFGTYGMYDGFSEEDILELVRYAKARKRRVAVIGLSGYAAGAIEEADLFLSPAELIRGEVLCKGNRRAVGTSCPQDVRQAAELLIPRPTGGGNGGLSAVIRSIALARAARRNLRDFFRYMLCTQWIRICIAGLPMLFGSVVMDARHLLFCGMWMDFCAMLLFASAPAGQRVAKEEGVDDFGLRSFIRSNQRLLVSALAASGCAVLLPWLVGLTGVFGAYLYKIEYTFTTTVFLHLTVLYFLRYYGKMPWKSLVRERYAIGYLAAVLGFLILCFAVHPIGYLFELTGNPLPYFLMTFIPLAVFAVVYLFLPAPGERRK